MAPLSILSTNVAALRNNAEISRSVGQECAGFSGKAACIDKHRYLRLRHKFHDFLLMSGVNRRQHKKSVRRVFRGEISKAASSSFELSAGIV